MAAATTAALGVVVLALVVGAATASADMFSARLKQTKAKQGDVQQQLKRTDQRRAVMSDKITEFDRRIDRLNQPIWELDNQISSLEAQTQHRRQRIVELRQEYRQQKVEIRQLSTEIGIAKVHLAQRAVTIYKTGGEHFGAWLVGAGSVRDLVARQEMESQIAELDSTIVGNIVSMQRDIRVKRANNNNMRTEMANDIVQIAKEVRDVAAKRSQIVGKKQLLEAARHERQAYLNQLDGHHKALAQQLDSLDQNASALQQAIKTGYLPVVGAPGGITASGLIWPVQGPIVSPFGWRWGRMHEGVDIAVPTGTPIHAAASGIVIYASWMNGYGNFELVQHQGGLVTGYAHQSQLAASVGQVVTQGQVIGYVGCTGHCFGPHLHFETRHGTTAVDPMQYL